MTFPTNSGIFGGSVARTQVAFHSNHHLQSLFQYSGPVWSLNAVKGAAFEKILPGIVDSGFVDRTGGQWTSITPHRSGQRGIDALFVRLDKAGRPSRLMVGEAKFGASRLSLTRDGVQMSDSWIRPRLSNSGRDYRLVAQAFDTCTVVRGSAGGLRQKIVPLRGGGMATVSIEGNRLFVEAPKGVSVRTVQRQANLCADICFGAGEGKIDYRSRLFRMSREGEKWTFGIIKLDQVSGGELGASDEIRGRFDELPKNIQRLMKQNVASELRNRGVNGSAADGLADQICRNPAQLDRTQLTRRTSWRIGFDRGMAVSATSAVMMTVLLEGIGSVFRKEVNGKRLAKIAFASGFSAGTGYYVGVQIQSRMIASGMPTASTSMKLLGGYGGAVAGMVTPGVFAGVGYALGFLSAKEAKVGAVAGTIGSAAGLGFGLGAVSIATTFGTASTGAAISTLHGAAATNAAFAFIGGGTIAAGGGGMAAGATVISGGTALIALAVCAGITAGAKKLNERERRLLVEARLGSVERLLSR